MHDDGCRRGRLISIEGLNGVGKTHLTNRLISRYRHDRRLVLLEEFSQRPHAAGADLGRDLLRTLITAANGDPFLRSGHPGAETLLLLLAIKLFDFESGCADALAQGCTVIEGRSVHSIAVYQSLITHTGDGPAHRQARSILDLAARWRPLPDLTILITDDVTTAVRRAESRDGTRYTDEQWRLHRRAAALFDHLAADEPDRISVLDRRRSSADVLVDQMAYLIGAAPAGCLPASTVQEITGRVCQQRCRLPVVNA